MVVVDPPNSPKAERFTCENLETASAGRGCSDQAIGLCNAPDGAVARGFELDTQGNRRGRRRTVPFRGAVCRGLSDEQILALFHNARKSDYEKLIQEANALLAEWSSGAADPGTPQPRDRRSSPSLQRRLDETAAIDFFQTPERATAELQLQELGNLLSGEPPTGNGGDEDLGDLKGKTWVTRSNLFVDRIACGWLIRRFVDESAVFKYVPGSQHAPKPNEVRFDMFDGEYTHEEIAAPSRS